MKIPTLQKFLKGYDNRVNFQDYVSDFFIENEEKYGTIKWTALENTSSDHAEFARGLAPIAVEHGKCVVQHVSSASFEWLIATKSGLKQGDLKNLVDILEHEPESENAS